jgi:hypothetical protein
MRKESALIISSLVILAVPTIYFLVIITEMFGSILTLQNPQISLDNSMNLTLLYSGGQLELGSLLTLIFAVLGTIVFGLLLTLRLKGQKSS